MSPEKRDAYLVGGTLIVGAGLGALGIRLFDRVAGRPDGALAPPAPTPPQGAGAGGAAVDPSRRSDAPAPEGGDLVATVWTGPVNLTQVAGAAIPGVPVPLKNCTGDGSPSCGQIADGWRDAQGRRLPALRRAMKIAEGPIGFGAFSAGGHLVRRVLEDPRDRAEVSAVVLADATYTTEWADKAKGLAAPIASFVAYGREVAADPARLFIATASSSPNKTHPTGAQTLAAIAMAIGLPEVTEVPGLPVALPKPARAWRSPSGSVVLLDYAAAFPPNPHEAHATKLAAQIWAALVIPHFARKPRA